MYFYYRNDSIWALAFDDNDVDVGISGDVLDGIDKRWLAMSCRHIGDENSVVDVEQHKSQQAPRSNDKTNWCDLARNVSTCMSDIFWLIVLLRNIVNVYVIINRIDSLQQLIVNKIHFTLIQ